MKFIPESFARDPVRPGIFNRIRDAVRRLGLGVDPPVLVTAPGRVTVDDDEVLLAILSGTVSPYTWQQVHRDRATGSFVPGPRSGVSNAYEVNNKARLNGRVVQLYPDYLGGYRFYWVGLTCTDTLHLTVQCGETDPIFGPVPVAGAEVTVQDFGGATVGACTTDGAGRCSVAGLIGGATYTITVDALGFASQTFVEAVGCPNTTLNVKLCRDPMQISFNVFTSTSNGTQCPLAGATVTVAGQATGSGTTDAAGHVTVDLTLSGGHTSCTVNLTATATAPAGFGAAAATLTIANFNTCSPGTRIIRLGPDASHADRMCGGRFLPQVLTYSDDFGFCDLHWNPTRTGHQLDYSGSYTFLCADTTVSVACYPPSVTSLRGVSSFVPVDVEVGITSGCDTPSFPTRVLIIKNFNVENAPTGCTANNNQFRLTALTDPLARLAYSGTLDPTTGTDAPVTVTCGGSAITWSSLPIHGTQILGSTSTWSHQPLCVEATAHLTGTI